MAREGMLGTLTGLAVRRAPSPDSASGESQAPPMSRFLAFTATGASLLVVLGCALSPDRLPVTPAGELKNLAAVGRREDLKSGSDRRT